MEEGGFFGKGPAMRVGKWASRRTARNEGVRGDSRRKKGVVGTEEGQNSRRERRLGSPGGGFGVGGTRRAEEQSCEGWGRGRTKEVKRGESRAARKRKLAKARSRREDPRVGRHKVSKGGSREAGIPSPVPGTARVRAARKRRASEGSPGVPAPRRPGVPERTWRRGGAEEFPSGGGGPQAALSPGGGCSSALTRAKAARTGGGCNSGGGRNSGGG